MKTFDRRRFWLWWVAASITGMAMARFLFQFIYNEIVGPGGDTTLFSVLPGLLMGTLQWLVLRRVVSRSGWWIPACMAGWALSGVVNVQLASFMTGSQNTPRFWVDVIHISVSGVSIGIAQWFVLRRLVSDAGWWVVATIAGMTLGWSLIPMVDRLMLMSGAGYALFTIMKDATAGAGIGMVTGYALIRMLKQADGTPAEFQSYDIKQESETDEDASGGKKIRITCPECNSAFEIDESDITSK